MRCGDTSRAASGLSARDQLGLLQPWLASTDLQSAPVNIRQFAAIVERFSWHRLASIANAWKGADAASGIENRTPIQAMQRLVRAMAGAEFGVHASSENNGLAISYGAPRDNLQLTAALHEFMEPQTLQDFGVVPRYPHRLAHRVVLRGTPYPSVNNASVMDALARTTGEFSVTGLFRGADRFRLQTQQRDIGNWIDLLREELSVSETVGRQSVTTFDANADAHLELLQALHRRYTSAIGDSGFDAVIIVESAEKATLQRVANAIVGTLSFGRSIARPLRAVPIADGVTEPEFWTHRDLAALIAPPSVETPRFRLTSYADFDQYPDTIRSAETGPANRFGHGFEIVIGANSGGAEIRLAAKTFSSHVVIGGTTGCGKTSLLLSLIAQFGTFGVPTTIIEPHKRDLVHALSGQITVIEVGAIGAHAVPLNPLWFPLGTSVQRHIELAVAAIGAAFDCDEAPIPGILTEAAVRAYERRGWNVVTNTHVGDLVSNGPLAAASTRFPTMRELRAAALEILDTRYRGETQSNVRGMIESRLNTLVEGPRAQTFDTDRDVDIDTLFRDATLINLHQLGGKEVQDFATSMLFIWLGELRFSQRSNTLEHVLVIEEAHSVFCAPAAGQPPSHATELLGNQLAELRSSGQGIILLDQHLSRLAENAIVNTATKIAMRIHAADDIALMKGLCGLSDQQALLLPSLPDHHAIVFSLGMDGAQKVATQYVLPSERLTGIQTPPPTELAAGGAGDDSGSLASRYRGVVVSGIGSQNVDRLADLVVATVGPIRAEALISLRSAVQRHLKTFGANFGSSANAVGDITLEALSSAVERYGRTRRLHHDQRVALFCDIASGDLDSDFGADAGQPFEVCAQICAEGLCRVREVGRSLAAEHGERIRSTTQPTQLAGALFSLARERCGSTIDPDVVRMIGGCALIHANAHISEQRCSRMVQDVFEMPSTAGLGLAEPMP